MMIDRRTFLQGAALVVTPPALAALFSFSSTVQSRASRLPCALPPPTAGSGTAVNAIVFKIGGWDRCGDFARDRSSADPVTKDSTANEVWIRINQSWRSAWR